MLFRHFNVFLISPRPRELYNASIYAPTRRKITRLECGLQLLFFRLLSVGLTDSSDSDGIEIVGVSTPRGNQPKKRKRQRSRSKSITPPPALPFHHIQNARNVVRLALDSLSTRYSSHLLFSQTLDHAPRAASPVLDVDDAGETVFSNPELARIAETIASRPAVHSQTPTRASSVEEHDTVTISVKWQPHPLNEAGKEAVWVFKMNRVSTPINHASIILTYNRTTTSVIYSKQRQRKPPS